MSTEEYTLTDEERELVDATLRPIEALQGELNAILSGILRRRRLTGQGWQLQGDKLVKPA